MKNSAISLVYFAFRAASADGVLHPREVQAIAALAKRRGVNDEKIEEVRAICAEEDEFRQKRVSTLFPVGVHTSIKAYADHFA